MKVALISTFEPATQLFLENAINQEEIAGLAVPVFRGKLYSKETYIISLTPGVDVSAIIKSLYSDYGVDCLISVGIAEPVLNRLKLGDIMVVHEAIVPNDDQSEIPAIYRGDQRLVDLALSAHEKLADQETTFRVLSGRTVTPELACADLDNDQEMNLYALDRGGFELARTCEEIELPYVLIRVIAGTETALNGESWEREGSKNSFWVVKSILETHDVAGSAGPLT